MKNSFLGALIGATIALAIGWLSIIFIGGAFGATTVFLLLVGSIIGYALGNMRR
ncbi:hypothetical protein [uncultured Kiloniella sp.]|uniref:hypothetical protein n=1 Tax=Kiloniella sp. TaxID=1938587 RepID=UPI00262A2495|nr:hypothetical protein [uncultured Kiloniella sp.]